MTNAGVPAYTALAFAPKKSRYCLCVFVLNEGARIQAQIHRSQSVAGTLDIAIADGGSTDGAVSPSFLRAQKIRALLTKAEPGQLGTQMRMAMHFALAEGYDGVITMDGNNKDNPEDAMKFVAALDEGFDHVQGSRYAPGGSSVNTPKLRAFAIRFIHAPLISLAARRRYTDTTNGFRAYSRKLMESGAIDLFRPIFRGYELHYYLAIRAARIGLNVCEVPVHRAYPAEGKVPTKITPLRGNLLVLRKLLAAVFGRFNPASPS